MNPTAGKIVVLGAPLAFAASVFAAPVTWTCSSATNPGGAPFQYVVNLDGPTIDGQRAALAGAAITQVRVLGGERVTTVLDTSSGALSVDGETRGSINRGVCEKGDSIPAAAVAQPPAAPAAQAESVEPATRLQATDDRPAELRRTYLSLLEQARAGKIKYLAAARQYQQRFEALYPEQASNASMNEYFAYMAVTAERVDKKKLTEAEAQYELAKKVSELQERAAAQQEIAARKQAANALADKAANDSAAQKERDERAFQLAKEEIAANRAAEERRNATQREIADRQMAQAEAQRKADSAAVLMQMGLQLLTPRRQPMCTGYWSGPVWVSTCN